MKRKLARIEIIKNIEPINGADNIEIAVVSGWKIVVRKDDGFKVGDPVMYFEIDSYLPVETRYEFLREYSYKKVEFKDGNPDDCREEGFRLKTKRLRGIYSQGLVMPINNFKKEIMENFPSGSDTDSWWTAAPIGADFTRILDIKLFVKPIPPGEMANFKGGYPFSIPKTDQERIQNLLPFMEEYKELSFEVTEKIDGMSMVVYWKDGDFGVCKREWDLFENDSNMLWKVARELELEKHLASLGKNIALQGELAGEGISKNPLGLKGKHYFLFDIWNIDERRYYTPQERKDVFEWLRDAAGVDHVPIVDPCIAPFRDLGSIDDIVAFASGKSMVSPSRKREGLVFKSIESVSGHVVSFKVIDNAYIVKQQEREDE